MASKGIKECPNGYETINDEKTCELASTALNLKYDERANENNSNAICFYCSRWCKPLATRLSSKHKKWAHFICQKGMHIISWDNPYIFIVKVNYMSERNFGFCFQLKQRLHPNLQPSLQLQLTLVNLSIE